MKPYIFHSETERRHATAHNYKQFTVLYYYWSFPSIVPTQLNILSISFMAKDEEHAKRQFISKFAIYHATGNIYIWKIRLSAETN